MHDTKSDKQAIVIGSGFGGIAAAIRLQAQGFYFGRAKPCLEVPSQQVSNFPDAKSAAPSG
ncbi:MAG: hypothetical protein EOP10_34690 [Proteobacteria bacterium]|nr:MAG: hypothetical protein EOP10_34690 [Pseudomonadota bacterium]